ncbi:MAG: SHOCT-like domain-containing protein [Chloroflexota bacterium]
MSAEERRQILKMVEDGKISAEEAMRLMRALDENAPEESVEVIEAAPAPGSEKTDAPEFEQVAARARRFAMIPVWIGIGVILVSGLLMYWAMQASGFGFWFYCMWFPFLFGVLILALGAGGHNSRWLFVDVHQRPGERPEHITLGFPIPLGLVGWALRNFGHHIKGMDRQRATDMADLVKATASSKSPLIVNANDDEDGERVQVYIG